MWKSTTYGLMLALIIGCAPKRVESPLEKAPPAEIARARALVARGDAEGAQSLYETFIISHQGTVEADLARLELGVLQADVGRCPEGIAHLEQAQQSPDRAISLRASLHLGSCQLRMGDAERALTTIEPVAGERFPDEEQVLLWDTAIVASELTTDAVLGLRVLDILIERGGDPPDPTRLWQTAQLLAERLTVEEATEWSTRLRQGALPQVAVSMRLLEDALRAQDVETVRREADVLRETEAMSIPEVTILVARADELLHGNPYAVGALLPLSGRGREVGRQLLEGMQLAQLEEGGPEILVEDTAGSASETERVLRSLIEEGGVVAVLGPVSSRTTKAAALASDRSGVPLITFSASETVTEEGDHVFRLLYSPREELMALVDAARAAGLSRFVILYPDHGYGRAVERIFDQEVAAAGGVACEGVPYAPGTKTFVEHVRTVLETSCDVVLLADVAEQVALIAPTFAAEGAWSTSNGSLPEHAEHEVHFLLPSVSWSPTLIARSRRYLQGARIALPYYEASETAEAERFRTAYQTRYGRPPETFAAYGYDAYRMVSSTLRQGHRTRSAVAEALAAGSSIAPVTSVDALGAERVPAEPPQVYRVVDELLERAN